MRHRLKILRSAAQQPGMPRLVYLKHKYGKLGLYHKLALKLYEQLVQAHYLAGVDGVGVEVATAQVGEVVNSGRPRLTFNDVRPSSRTHITKRWKLEESRRNAMRSVVRRFPTKAMFREAELDPDAVEAIIMNARRWVACPKMENHGIHRQRDYCNKCGHNRHGYLLKMQNRYHSTDISQAAEKIPKMS